MTPIQKALDALKGVTAYAELQVCEHESTHRGGTIWEICDDCGAKWADDRGGKKKFEPPVAIKNAREAIAALEATPLTDERIEKQRLDPSLSLAELIDLSEKTAFKAGLHYGKTAAHSPELQERMRAIDEAIRAAVDLLAAQPPQRPEEAGYIPISDDGKSVFIDGMGEIPLAYPAMAQPVTAPNMDAIHKAWHAVGADVAGLSWERFVKAIPAKPEQAPEEPEEWAKMRALGWTIQNCRVCGSNASAMTQPLQAQPVAPDAITWPKERRVGRREDMSPKGTLIVGLDSDNDVYVAVASERHGDWQDAAVEFCNGGGGGGSSPRTRAALINLMTAIEADNADRPDKAFPPRSKT